MIDTEIHALIEKEQRRQDESIELIPSENYTSSSVRAALGSVFVNKYSEGYPKKRYYGGNEYVDIVELLAIDRAKKLFNVPFVNVQPYSGSPANLAVYLAVASPGDTIMGQSLTAGGHLTHGHTVSATGIFYKSISYGLSMKDKIFAESQLSEGRKTRVDLSRKFSSSDHARADLFNYDEIRALAKKHKPKLIWVGATAYPFIFHYDKFAAIADEVGAYLAADISHVAGLIVGEVHPSPIPHAHIVTTTTHKTLRGPRGAMIMVTEKGLKKDPDLASKINKAVFPGLQGGPHDNQTAAIAVALYEASLPSFKTYAKNVVENSCALAKTLMKGGIKLVGDGTENHLILADLTSLLGPGGGIFPQYALDRIGLTVNKNTIPSEPSSPFYPSGIRLGTPAATTRGMGKKEMDTIGKYIVEVIHMLKPYRLPQEKDSRMSYISQYKKEIKTQKKIMQLGNEVKELSLQFPIP